MKRSGRADNAVRSQVPKNLSTINEIMSGCAVKRLVEQLERPGIVAMTRRRLSAVVVPGRGF